MGQTLMPHSQVASWAQGRSWEILPQIWYEHKLKPYILYVIVTFSLGYYSLSKFGMAPPTWFSILGLIVYVGGFVLDTVTTSRCFHLKAEFDSRCLEFPVVESNLFMPDFVGWREQLFSVSTLLSLLYVIPIWLMPALGVVMGLLHTLAALSNRRKTRRLKLLLVLFDRYGS